MSIMLHRGSNFTTRPVERGERGKFSRAPRRFFGGWGAPSLKNTEKGVPYGFFLTSNMHKIHFRPGLSAPDPAGAAYIRRSHRSLVRW